MKSPYDATAWQLQAVTFNHWTQDKQGLAGQMTGQCLSQNSSNSFTSKLHTLPDHEDHIAIPADQDLYMHQLQLLISSVVQASTHERVKRAKHST
jgi:hypothetical protein